MENQLFEPEKNPAELGKKCGWCVHYWRETFVAHSKASCGRCEIHWLHKRIKSRQPACGKYED